MTISAIGATQSGVAFQGKPYPGSGGAGKSWCSAVIPGFGQFLDGRNGAGALFLGTSAAALGLTGWGASKIGKLGFNFNLLNLLQGKLLSFKLNKGVSKTKIGLVAGAAAVTAGLWFCNVINAYKGRRNA